MNFLKNFSRKLIKTVASAPSTIYKGVKAAPSTIYKGIKAAPSTIYKGIKAAPSVIIKIPSKIRSLFKSKDKDEEEDDYDYDYGDNYYETDIDFTQTFEDQQSRIRSDIITNRPLIELIAQDQFRNWYRRNYRINAAINSLEKFYDTIISFLTNDSQKNIPDVNYITLVFRESGGRTFFRDIRIDYFIDFETFEDYLTLIVNGNNGGSDPINPEVAILDTSFFQTKKSAASIGVFGGKNKYVFCEVEHVEGYGTCFFDALEKCLHIKIDDSIKKKYVDLSKIHDIMRDIDKLHVNVIIYNDIPDCEYNLSTIELFKNKQSLLNHNGLFYKPLIFDKLMINEFSYISWGSDNIYLVYKNNHVDIFKNIINNDFYSNTLTDFYKKNNETNELKLVMKRNDVIKNHPKNKKILQRFNTIIVNFDCESVFDIHSCDILKPYSIAFNIDEDFYFYFGDDCVDRFIDELMERQKGNLFVLNGYNSSRFDNYFLPQYLAKIDALDSIFYNKNQILNIKFSGRHTTFDTCKFTMRKLKDACKDFKISASKGDLDHSIVQRDYNKYGNVKHHFHDKECEFYDKDSITLKFCCPEEFEVMDDEKIVTGRKSISEVFEKSKISQLGECKCLKFHNLVEYNLVDIQCCEQLYRTIEQVCINYVEKGKSFFDYKTIGSFIYNYFSRSIRERNFNVPLYPSLDFYKAVRSGLIAGRTQCYKNTKDSFFYDLSGDNEYYMLDVKSLYPYVMLNRNYPMGDIIKYKTGYPLVEQAPNIHKIVFKDVTPDNIYKQWDGKTLSQCSKDPKFLEMCNGNVKDIKGLKQILKTIDGDTILFDGKKTKNSKYVGIKLSDLIQDPEFLSWCSRFKPKKYEKVQLFMNQKKPVLKSYKKIMEEGLIGFFMCKKIDQSNLKKKILPVRGQTLDWSTNQIIENVFINTIDIKCLLDYGCVVEIDEDYELNHYFTETISGKELFKCLETFKKIKEEQDNFKRNNDDCYNPALREMAKLFLNNLSGKVIEGLHIEQIKYIKNQSQFTKLLEEYKDEIEVIQNYDGYKGLVKFNVDENEALKDNNKPLYIGTLIYSYARDHMFRTIIHDYDIIYQDTDSGLLCKSEYLRLVDNDNKRVANGELPLIGENFGQYEVESKNGKNFCNRVVTLAPKNYFLLCGTEDNLTVFKKGFKGINLDNDLFLNEQLLNDYFVRIEKINKKSKITTISYDLPDDHSGVSFDLYNSVLKHRKLSDINVLKEFIDHILLNKNAYIMCSSLLKQRSDSKNKIGGNLYQRYMLKKISV